jgi:hypothetical protein
MTMYVRGNSYGLLAMQQYGAYRGYGQMEPTEALIGALTEGDDGSYIYMSPLGTEEEAWNALAEDLYILEAGGWSTLDQDVFAYDDGSWQTVAVVIPPTAAGPESARTGREGAREETVEELIERDVERTAAAVEPTVADIEGVEEPFPWGTAALIVGVASALGLAGYGVYRTTRGR